MDLPEIQADWLTPPDLATAARVQRDLAGRVVPHGPDGPVRTVAGVDVSQFGRDPSGRVFAAVVLLDAATREVLEVGTAMRVAPIPYVPGFLGFREVPALLAAFGALSRRPDLVLVDGHGTSHPRGLGIAAHLGVLLDIPAIGVAKSILVGAPAGELGGTRGSRVPLVWQGRTIATVLRSKDRVAPLYVSTGHRIDEEAAVDWTLRLGGRYRLPEPTRRAHEAANAFRRAWGTGAAEGSGV
ncbi:endonuclease V [Rhodospirillum centenum]|uniref:Endonuclease V n=1 Tax=Rhodospirillum centenum (strain ATCC 51521 / SW) TaxID=414684 RepID=NFI_RHOCS|nr:endonuclease V [Rhodospirillum centenum]B6IUZ1.1 RecName: Full=Endonuclease V; AltName: Full=Deoxyinosine 3'endonuclease; AltName: Full=Deoxyribonuclease V; Short=DNase V [Rhodospirillum centenum SW]ACJ00073.1 endonuclease V, putative [Rhodospirillum centenum SW]